MSAPIAPETANPEDQVEAIHSMLVTGHRAILMEVHTLVLWGLFGGVWVLAEKWFFEARFPDHWQRAVFSTVAFCVGLALIAALDFLMTRRARRRRDESYPFIQRQIGKLSLLLLGLGMVTGLGGWFHVWETVVFVVWMIVLGLILYAHGLFSNRFLEWVGLAILALAVGAVALKVSFEGTRYLLAATSALGLPIAGLLVRYLNTLEPRSLSNHRPQFDAIRAMLTIGERSVLIEPHSFVLWGISVAVWMLVDPFDTAFSSLNLPFFSEANLGTPAFLETVFTGALMALVATADFLITRRAKRNREESYPFRQRQMGKLTLLLVGLGVLASFGAWFFPWSVLIFVFWMVIAGLVFFVHGLFSEPFLEWTGFAIIFLAVATVPLEVPFEGTRWLLIALCGLGLPMLGLVIRPLARRALPVRLLSLCAWAGLVCFGAYVGYKVVA